MAGKLLTCIHWLAEAKKPDTDNGKRGNIVHSGEGDASLGDIDDFGELTRRVALAMLDKLEQLGDEIGTVEKLEV